MLQAVLSGLAPHLSNPYLENSVAVNGWEVLVGVHPRLGKDDGDAEVGG